MDPSQSRSCRRRRAAPAGNIEQPDANILPEQRSYGTSQRTVNSRNAVCAARDCGVIKYINNKMGIYVRLKRLPMAVPLRILTYSILTLIAVGLSVDSVRSFGHRLWYMAYNEAAFISRAVLIRQCSEAEGCVRCFFAPRASLLAAPPRRCCVLAAASCRAASSRSQRTLISSQA